MCKYTSIVSDSRDIDQITGFFDDRITVSKIKKSYSGILQEDILILKNFPWKRLDQTKMFEIKLKKSSIYQAILVYVLKQSIEVHLKCLTNTTNHSLTKAAFPDKLKLSQVISIY